METHLDCGVSRSCYNNVLVKVNIVNVTVVTVFHLPQLSGCFMIKAEHLAVSRNSENQAKTSQSQNLYRAQFFVHWKCPYHKTAEQ